MPRVMIEITDAWLARYEAGVAQCLDTLDGIVHQIDRHCIEDGNDSVTFLWQLRSQLEDLRRNVQSWRHMF